MFLSSSHVQVVSDRPRSLPILANQYTIIVTCHYIAVVCLCVYVRGTCGTSIVLRINIPYQQLKLEDAPLKYRIRFPTLLPTGTVCYRFVLF